MAQSGLFLLGFAMADELNLAIAPISFICYDIVSIATVGAAMGDNVDTPLGSRSRLLPKPCSAA